MPKKMKPQIPKLVVGIFVLGVISCAVVTYLESQAPQLSNSASVETSPQPKEKKITLVREKNGEAESLYSTSSFYIKDLDQWQNILFFRDEESNPPRLVRHDMSTGKTTTVFTQPEGKFIGDPQILDDVLYFSVGEYLGEGATYRLPLPVRGQPQKFSDKTFSEIKKMRDTYWAINGFGDSCIGILNFSFFNPKTLTATEMFTSLVGCQSGEEVRGLTADHKMILATHTIEADNAKIPRDSTLYTKVAVASLSNPTERVNVISEEQMPKNIYDLLYSEQHDQLLLLGPEIYLFDFSKNSLEKLFNMPTNFSDMRLVSWEESLVCLITGSGDHYYEIHFDAKELLLSQACADQSPYSEKAADNFISKFNLQQGYSFEVKEIP